MKIHLVLAGYLAFKELWRNRGRFLLVSLIVALITLLVLFIAGLSEGLGNGNREYLSKLDADLIVFQGKSELLIQASRLSKNRLAAIRRIQGVRDTAMLGTASATLVFADEQRSLKVALLGIEPGHIGEPRVIQGSQLSNELAKQVIIDRNTALRGKLKIGDTLQLRVTQGIRDEFFEMRIVGIADGQQFSLQPSIFLPFNTWDRIRPKSEAEVNISNPVANVILVQLDDPRNANIIRDRLLAQVDNIEVATLQEAILALPGYSAQQSTLNTQGGFTLFIGLLVIGGFFQIQILQKVAQIGVLKAIGADNRLVAAATIIQIVAVTMTGVSIGGLLTYLFSLAFPPTVPIVFNGVSTVIAIVALLVIGPLGGFMSIRYAVKIEPLKALGLS